MPRNSGFPEVQGGTGATCGLAPAHVRTGATEQGGQVPGRGAGGVAGALGPPLAALRGRGGGAAVGQPSALNCGDGAEFEGLVDDAAAVRHADVGVLGKVGQRRGHCAAGLDVVDGADLAADGEALLGGRGAAADLGQGCYDLGVGAEVGLASAENDGCVGVGGADLANPFGLDVVQGDGVGDLVTRQEDVCVRVGETADRVESRGP